MSSAPCLRLTMMNDDSRELTIAQCLQSVECDQNPIVGILVSSRNQPYGLTLAIPSSVRQTQEWPAPILTELRPYSDP